jgi:signal transduction histidine kinase
VSKSSPTSYEGSLPAVPDPDAFDLTQVDCLGLEFDDLGTGGSFNTLFQETQVLREQIACHAQLMQLLTHQLATPLTTLSGSMHLLAEPDLDPEQQREFLEVVEQQIHRLRELLKDLMALRNLETGGLDCQPVGFCLRDLIDEVVAHFAPYPVTHWFGAEVTQVWGDRWQISQVLVNLLSNAIKYSPKGQPIEVGFKQIDSDWVEVWVKDEGLGIPEAAQPHLFERFYRVKDRDRQNINGTGLGLSLCKLLVENQGGQIGFESTHGQGSCFHFTLPTSALRHLHHN